MMCRSALPPTRGSCKPVSLRRVSDAPPPKGACRTSLRDALHLAQVLLTGLGHSHKHRCSSPIACGRVVNDSLSFLLVRAKNCYHSNFWMRCDIWQQGPHTPTPCAWHFIIYKTLFWVCLREPHLEVDALLGS